MYIDIPKNYYKYICIKKMYIFICIYICVEFYQKHVALNICVHHFNTF